MRFAGWTLDLAARHLINPEGVIVVLSGAEFRVLKRDHLVERCATLGRVLQRRLATLAELPHVGDVRGRGLLAGIEFVEDKATRAPFPRAAKFVEAFTKDGGKITTREVVPDGTSDFHDFLDTALPKKPEMIFFGGEYKVAATLRAQATDAATHSSSDIAARAFGV